MDHLLSLSMIDRSPGQLQSDSTNSCRGSRAVIWRIATRGHASYSAAAMHRPMSRRAAECSISGGIEMSRSVLAIAVMLLPLPALAQSAPQSAPQSSAAPQAEQAVAASQQASPEKRGFSIARAGSPAAAKTTAAKGPTPRTKMAAPATSMTEATAGTMKHPAKRHHRRHKRHHS